VARDAVSRSTTDASPRPEAPYPRLLSSVRVGPLQLRNRVLLTAMTTGFGYDAGLPNDDLSAFLGERAGDLGLTTVAFGAVSPEGRVEDKIPWMWLPDVGDRLTSVADTIHAAGGLASLQIGHGGRQVAPETAGGQPVAPSPLPPLVHVKVAPRELSIPEIEAIVESFGHAAEVAAAAGFDAIEVHGGHGYLIHQFLSADANRRTDGYGGASTTDRARFGVEVLRRVRRATAGLALLVRINGSDLYPAGMQPSDAAQTAVAFAGAGADAVIVSAGVYGTVPYTIPLLDDAEAPYLSAAAHVRAHVEIPVVAVSGFSRPAVAEAALERGDCDAVAIGRALLADPRWVAKAAAGRAADIRPCVATIDACAGMLAYGEAISCSVNPEVGRERRAQLTRAPRAARIIVVGLGAAGLEAACRAAELGHEVIAFERAPQAGGSLILAALTPPLSRYGRLLAWFTRRLEQAEVEVRLGEDASGEIVQALGAELVVVATGSLSEPPVLDGYDELPTWTIEELLAGRPSSLDTAPAPVAPVVVGDGRIAMAGALALAGRTIETTLLHRGRVGSDASALSRVAYVSRLERQGVRRVRGRPVRLAAEGVWWTDDDGGEGLASGDAVVLADRRRPERPAGMEQVTAEVIRVGDAREPRDLTAAIAEGREAVEAFTRALEQSTDAVEVRQ
jgi:2,4-dienoyl-CoA reductase-like NADH-dependent reductase (Old Yellow Enzyme family)